MQLADASLVRSIVNGEKRHEGLFDFEGSAEDEKQMRTQPRGNFQGVGKLSSN